MASWLLYFIAIPILGAIFIALIRKNVSKSVVRFIATSLMASLFLMSIYSLQYLSNKIVFKDYFFMDSFTIFMLIILNTITLANLIYSWRYIEHYDSEWRYYTLYLLMVAGMNGVLIMSDMFSLYIFLEIASVSSYILVSYGCKEEQLEASFKYIILGGLASVMILFGVGILYYNTSSLNMDTIANTLPDYCKLSPLIFLIAGFGLKAAIVPFHSWLPDAHTAAPAPISATLSGVLIKVLGIYTLSRVIFNVIGLTPQVSNLMLTLGCASMILGALLAIYQWDFKRLLAYSSISQIGYIVVGLFLGTPLGILGGLFHLLNHSIFKSLLFLNAGAVEYATGTRQLNDLGGLRNRMPVTANTSLIGSMAISGIPPFNGFWSKLIIIIACVQSNHITVAIIAALVSIVTLAYFLKVQRYAFFGKLNKAWEEIKEVPPSMRYVMVSLAILCILTAFLAIPSVSNQYLKPVVDVLINK